MMISLLLLVAASNPFGINAQSIGLPVSTPDLGAAMASIVEVLMGLMGGLALVFLIIGGLRYVISRGEPKATQQARETILYAAVGLVVAIAAYAVVKFLAGVTTTQY